METVINKRRRVKTKLPAASAKPGEAVVLYPPKEKQPRTKVEWVNFRWLQLGLQLNMQS